MAKATVLRCDVGGEWDSEDNPVRTVGICGPKFDICAVHRVEKLVLLGVDPLLAATYVEQFDARANVRGTTPTLAWVQKSLRKGELAAVTPVTDPETDAETDDDVDQATIGQPTEGDHESAEVIEMPAPEGDAERKAPSRRSAKR